MSGTLRVDTSRFNSMVREIARKAGVPNEEVLSYEVGKVLEQTVKNTKSATVSSIRATSENAEFSMQPATLYSPVNGRAGVKITKGGFIPYYLRNRYPNTLWGKITERRKASLIARLKARGLARRSWVDIARKLGLSISYPGYVGTAIPSNGREHPENTNVRLQRQNGRLQIAFENSQPTVNRIGGGRALQTAIDGRYKFFIQNVARGEFESVKRIAKRYPGITIK